MSSAIRWITEPREIDMTPEQEQQLVSEVLELIRRARERKDLEAEWREAQAQFDGRMDADEDTDEPDVDPPLTWERFQAIASRICNPIMKEDPKFLSAPRKGAESAFQNVNEFAEQIEAALDWKNDQYDFGSWIYSLLRDMAIYRICVTKVPLVVETEERLEWEVREETSEVEAMPEEAVPAEGMPNPMMNPAAEPQSFMGKVMTAFTSMMGMRRREQVGRLVRKTRDLRRGGYPVRVSPENFLMYPLNSPDLASCELVGETFWKSRRQVDEAVAKGQFRPVADQLKYMQQPTSANQTKDEREQTTGTQVTGTSAGDLAELVEAYVYVKREAKAGSWRYDQAIVTVDVNAKVIVQALWNDYASDRIPYFTHTWEQIPGQVIGRSFCERLRDCARIITGIIRIVLHNAMKRNDRGWATDDDEVFEKLSGRRLKLGEILKFAELPSDHIMPLDLAMDLPDLGFLLEWAEIHMDKQATTSDTMFGINRQDRPTATTTIKTAEEGQQPLQRQLEAFRRYLSKVMLACLSRDRQFFPGGLTYLDRLGVPQRLEFPPGFLEDQLLIETKASAASLNAEVRRQEQVALLERMEKSYDKLLAFVGMASDPMNPNAPAALRVAQAYSTMIDRVLTELQVKHTEEINPKNLEQEVLDARAQALVQLVQQQQAALGQLQAELQAGRPDNGGPGGPGPVPPPSTGA